MTKFFSATSKTKRQINANDKSALMTIAAAVVLLGAFFVINPINLTAFAAVDPDMIDNSTGDFGPVHPGDLLTQKNVTLVAAEHGLEGLVNVTFAVYNEGTMTPCLDLTSNLVLNLTTANVTTFIDTSSDSFLLYDEFLIGMPGVYHCNVVFTADNGTDTFIIGNQTAWVDGIGSKGFWKNHPNATEQHLPINLGGFLVGDNETATDIFEKHKKKMNLDKVGAQLLASLLNVWALDMGTNSSKTSCINATITFTNATLADEPYNGNVGSKQFVTKNTDLFTGLSLNHTALDNFNNNGC